MRKEAKQAIGILAVIALGIGLYFAYDNFVAKPKRASQEKEAQEKQGEEAEPSDKTTNWKTYKTGYGFEFKYPEKWKIVDVPANDTIYFFNYDSIKKGVVIDKEGLEKGINNSDMEISIEENPKNLSAEEFFVGRNVAFEKENNKLLPENKIINGLKVIIFPRVEAENNPIFREAIIKARDKFIIIFDGEPFEDSSVFEELINNISVNE